MHSDWVIFLQYFNAYIRFIRKYFATNLNWKSETREFKENSFKVLHLSIEKKNFFTQWFSLSDLYIFPRKRSSEYFSPIFSFFPWPIFDFHIFTKKFIANLGKTENENLCAIRFNPLISTWKFHEAGLRCIFQIQCSNIL